MNLIKLILIIIAILGILTASVMPATANDRNWNGNEDTDWFEPLNWNEGFVPGSDDDVIIGEGFNVLIADNLAPAECKTLDIERATILTIKGMALKLGDSGADTTSNLAPGANLILPATINMVEDSGGAPGVLILYRWVTFEGGGSIHAIGEDPAGNGVVKRAGGANDKGIVIADLRFLGQIDVMCDFDLRDLDTEVGQRPFSYDTMTFGPVYDDIDYREPYIKGGGTISAMGGTVRFGIVDFDATNAPNWVIAVGTIQLTHDANSSHYTNESFNISKAGPLGGRGIGTLILDHSLATTGELRVNTRGANGKLIITVASGTVFSVAPADP